MDKVWTKIYWQFYFRGITLNAWSFCLWVLDFIIKKLRITGWSPYLNGDLSADYHFAVVLSCSNLPCVYKLNFTCFAALKMSKKRQDTWQLCELCGRLFYCHHLSDHRAICEGNSTAECPQHAYIQDGVSSLSTNILLNELFTDHFLHGKRGLFVSLGCVTAEQIFH